MKLFECQNCGQPLYFENTGCSGLLPGYGLGVPMTSVVPGVMRWRPDLLSH